MGFSRQECWSGLPFPSPGDLPDPGIEPGSPALQADALPSEPPMTRTCQKDTGTSLRRSHWLNLGQSKHQNDMLVSYFHLLNEIRICIDK